VCSSHWSTVEINSWTDGYTVRGLIPIGTMHLMGSRSGREQIHSQSWTTDKSAMRLFARLLLTLVYLTTLYCVLYRFKYTSQQFERFICQIRQLAECNILDSTTFFPFLASLPLPRVSIHPASSSYMFKHRLIYTEHNWLVDWVKVLRSTRQKIGHFGDVLFS